MIDMAVRKEYGYVYCGKYRYAGLRYVMKQQVENGLDTRPLNIRTTDEQQMN